MSTFNDRHLKAMVDTFHHAFNDLAFLLQAAAVGKVQLEDRDTYDHDVS